MLFSFFIWLLPCRGGGWSRPLVGEEKQNKNQTFILFFFLGRNERIATGIQSLEMLCSRQKRGWRQWMTFSMCVTSRLFFVVFFYVTDPCRQARQFSPFSLANPTSYPNPFSFLSIKERQTTKSFAKTDGGSCLPFFFFSFFLHFFCCFVFFLLENCLKAPPKK